MFNNALRIICTDRNVADLLKQSGFDRVIYAAAPDITDRDVRWAEAFAFADKTDKTLIEKNVYDNFYQLELFNRDKKDVVIGTVEEILSYFGVGKTPKARKGT